jgi:hypothetical protein
VARWRGSRPSRTVIVAACLAVVAVALTSCGSDHPTRVLVIGDSLVSQASRSLRRDLEARHYKVDIEALAGTATCDWFANAKKAVDGFHPDIVAMSFSGNAIGPCMKRRDGSPLSDAEYRAKYRADTERMLHMFGNSIPVYLVGAPVSGTGDDRVFEIYQQLTSRASNVHFVDGGKYVTPQHRYVRMLPCLRGEPCTGPVVNGVHYNVVRAPDRAHFCPVAQDPRLQCPVWSSGAYRFALAIAQAVEQGVQ